MLECIACSRFYKNKESLRAHRNRYHPYPRKTSKSNEDVPYSLRMTKSTKIEDDISSINSDISSSFGETSGSVLEMRIKSNKLDIESVEEVLNTLKKRVYDLESKHRLQSWTLDSAKQKDDKTQKIIDNSSEICMLKLQSNINRQNIESIRNQLRDLVDNSDVNDRDSLTSDDLIDEMMEIRDLVVAQDFEAIKTKIQSIIRAVKLVLSGLNLDVLSSDDILLLEDISSSSIHDAKQLVQDKFSHIATIFEKLKPSFDKAYEEYESEETHNSKQDDEETEQSENEETDNEGEEKGDEDQNSNDTSDSYDENDSETESNATDLQ